MPSSADPVPLTAAAACLHELVEAQAQETPDALAVVTSSARVSYGQLDRRANALACELRDRGVGVETIVGLYLDRSVEALVAILGTLKAGGAYLPLDVRYPAARIRFCLEDSGAPVVVTRRSRRARLPVSGFDVIELDSLHASEAERAPPALATPANLAYVMYTSGSTGIPKGVLIEHRSVVNEIRAAMASHAVGPVDRVLQMHSPSFDISIEEIFSTLASGATLVMYDDQWSPFRLVDLIEREQISVLNMVPTFFHEWIVGLAAEGRRVPSSVRLVVLGGEKLRAESFPVWHRLGATHIPWLNSYGPTEAAITTTVHLLRHDRGQPPPGEAANIGLPIRGATVHVVDEQLRPVAPGAIGELVIGGVGVARGYLDRPGLTAERFVPDPFSGAPGARIYRTGDLSRVRPDGDVEIHGRTDHQLKIRSYRIEPREIETVLVQHELVRDAIVAAYEDDRPARLIAYVVPDQRSDAFRSLVRAHRGEWCSTIQASYTSIHYAREPGPDPALDTRGWISSDSNEPFGDDVMRDWVECSLRRILALGPRHVLEIGCGTGLVLHRLASHCERYVGTDLDPMVLEGLERGLRQTPLAKRVRLLPLAAHRIDELGAERFDTIVLNSVIQHFPDLDYLSDVIERAAGLLAPGGSMFIGDVRSLPLLGAFRAWADSARQVDRSERRRRVEHAARTERELVVDPEYFRILAAARPLAWDLAIELRRCRHLNEMSLFRYDVTLRTDPHPPSDVPDPIRLVWGDSCRRIGDLAVVLGAHEPACVVVSGVPNARLVPVLRQAHDLWADAPEPAPARVLPPCSCDEGMGIDPEAFWALGDALSYRVEVTPASSGEPDRFDAQMFRGAARARISSASSQISTNGPRDAARIAPGEPAPEQRQRGGGPDDARALATLPARFLADTRMSSILRDLVSSSLPPHMVPAAFIYLDALPRLPNGKLDRNQLPAPTSDRRMGGVPYQAARSAAEAALVAIWEDTLSVRPIGIDDDFLDLGGDSLAAMRIASRANREGMTMHGGLVLQCRIISRLAATVGPEEPRAAPEPSSAAPPTPTRETPEAPVLSCTQDSLWFIDQMGGGSPQYNTTTALRLLGPVDRDVLERSMNAVVRRHGVLRTTYALVEGAPVPTIDDDFTLQISIVCLEATPDDLEAEVQRLARAESREPMNLVTGPVIRAKLLQLSSEHHVLLCTVHHIATDGWSDDIFWEQVGAAYRDLAAGNGSTLGPPGMQFHEFAAAQRQWMETEEFDRELGYWSHQLRAPREVLELPTDRPRPSSMTQEGATLRIALLPAAETAVLARLARTENTTLFMVLLAAFNVLLHRLTGQTDLLVGTNVAGRSRIEHEAVIGFFVNTLVIRTDLAGDPSFRDALRRVRAVALDAFAHQDVPLACVVDALKPERDPGRAPLTGVLFVLQPEPVSDLGLPGVVSEPVYFDRGLASFDMTLDVYPEAGGLVADWEFRTDLFDRETIDRIHARLRVLLEGILAHPDESISRLPVLPAAERDLILREWNRTQTEYPATSCVHDLFTEQAARTPDSLAARCGGAEITYGELERRSNQLAHYLQSLGVGPEARVALCVERSIDFVIGFLAVMKAGGAYVPLDPAYPEPRLAFMIEDAAAAVVLTHARWADRFRGEIIRIIALDEDLSALARAPETPPRSGVGPDNLAYVMYTSGSTGKPKGVLVPHRGVVNHNVAIARTYRLEPGDRVLQMASISFDGSVEEIFPALVSGAAVVIHPDPPSPAELGRFVDREQVTALFATPSYLNHWMAELERSGDRPPRSLRVVGPGSEPVRCDTYRRWRRLTGDRVPWIEVYGPTEATITATTLEFSPALEHDPRCLIGRPIANTKVYVVDRFTQPVPIGVPGELVIGGVGIAAGYHARPELTSAQFIADPFDGAPGARLYRTGDRARWLADGSLEYLGRTDDQVKIRGIRIELGDVEAALSSHPAIAQAVVAVRDSAGDSVLVGYYVARQEPAPSPDDLRRFLVARIPQYMVPSILLQIEDIPLSPNGKADRRALPAPQRATANNDPPHGETERAIAEVWSEMLGVARPGRSDHFFELGGHSLLASRVAARLSDRLGVRVPLRALFDQPILSELAHWLGGSSR